MPAGLDMKALSPAAQACLQKMEAAKVNAACIRTFLKQHAVIASGETGSIPDSAISPVDRLDALDDLHAEGDAHLLERTVVLKLNGGLGTGMGLHDAKSLLEVKDGNNFLDFTAKQVEYLRQHHSPNLRFMLMNSFNTEKSTRAFLKKYPALAQNFEEEVQLLQNQVPKILKDSLEPATWPANPANEWAPPGHGDLYTALYGSGKLDELIQKGYTYMFVSNGDNLGATLDRRVLAYMESHKYDFLMEVCRRTDSDRKGGHLARKVVATGEKPVLLLREAAQCPKEDEENFQDIAKYAFFNTNNLWVNLPALAAIMQEHDGALPLPVIRNEKTVDATDSASPKVYQLETAMGAAISLFPRATALVVPRSRFAPVKTCADLLSLRSDAYAVTPDFRLVLDERCQGRPPLVDLDGKYYKMMAGFEKLIAKGVPSMVECRHLTVKGPVVFGKGNVLKGEVTIVNDKADTPLEIPEGTVMDKNYKACL